MRMDSHDRFGTSLEQFFTRKQGNVLLEAAGLRYVWFIGSVPDWYAIGAKQ
jgi:hypothetical protein